MAELEMEPDEAEYLRAQLNGQLRAVREMADIEIGPDAPVTSHGVPYPPEVRPRLRDDVVVPCENPDEIVAQAPETASGYIVVPEIPHTDLE